MALRFCDSFDHYATADFAAASNYAKYAFASGASIAAGQGRTANALDLSAGTDAQVYPIFDTGDPQGTWIVGVALKTSAIAATVTNFISLSESVGQLSLRITATTGTFQVVREPSTVLGTSTYAIPLNTWIYVEFKAVIHSSAGSYEVRVNGANILSASGVNTSNSGNPYAYAVLVRATTSGTRYMDDLYVCDGTGTTNNNFLGDVTVKAVLPDAAGNYAQFTPSAGSNYQNVDDTAPDGDGTYNGAADAGKKDSYSFAAVGLTGPVLGVQTVVTARKDIGGSKIVKDLVRIGSTDYAGSNRSLTDAYKMHRTIRELNPATSANWTIAQIDAAEFGVEVVS